MDQHEMFSDRVRHVLGINREFLISQDIGLLFTRMELLFTQKDLEYRRKLVDYLSEEMKFSLHNKLDSPIQIMAHLIHNRSKELSYDGGNADADGFRKKLFGPYSETPERFMGYLLGERRWEIIQNCIQNRSEAYSREITNIINREVSE